LDLTTTKIELGIGADVWVVEPTQRSLRKVLSDYLGRPEAEIEIVRGEHGKPHLAEGGLEFNLSHSGKLTLLAVSRSRPVGIDIEEVKPGRNFLALAERALGPGEVATVREAAPEERPGVFYRHWVRHEARLKCLGVGLFGAAPATPVEVQDLDIAPGYTAAVAVASSSRSASAT
jgi:4'-phosphopantetheinyl transferase